MKKTYVTEMSYCYKISAHNADGFHVAHSIHPALPAILPPVQLVTTTAHRRH